MSTTPLKTPVNPAFTAPLPHENLTNEKIINHKSIMSDPQVKTLHLQAFTPLEAEEPFERDWESDEEDEEWEDEL